MSEYAETPSTLTKKKSSLMSGSYAKPPTQPGQNSNIFQKYLKYLKNVSSLISEYCQAIIDSNRK